MDQVRQSDKDQKAPPSMPLSHSTYRISFPVKSVSSLAEALDALIQVDKLILHLSEL